MSIFRKSRSRDEAPRSERDDRDDRDEAASEPLTDKAPIGAGPYDVSEVLGRSGRVDFGSLWLRVRPGSEVRLEVDEDTQTISSITLVWGASAMQLQAFAAPRTDGVWDEVRREIAISVEQQGGLVETVEGEFGTEMRVRVPQQDAAGRKVLAPAVFLGVDGPRWFVRGVLSGAAATDDAQSEDLRAAFRDLVVVRGQEPMAPRELLPFELPKDIGAEAAGDAARAAGS